MSEQYDTQDGAEALDETNLDGDEQAGEMRTFEELPDLLDLTTADGDRDEDEAVALDADEFDEDAVDDGDLEDDNELDYHAATEEREDDLDGLGPQEGGAEDGFNEDKVEASSVGGLDEQVLDADGTGDGDGEVPQSESRTVSDADLIDLGYSEEVNGEARAKP